MVNHGGTRDTWTTITKIGFRHRLQARVNLSSRYYKETVDIGPDPRSMSLEAPIHSFLKEGSILLTLIYAYSRISLKGMA